MTTPPTDAPAEDIVVYGTSWCPDVRRSRAVLDEVGLTYTYVDVDDDKAALRRVRALQKGARRVPTIVIGSGPVLVEPTDDDLRGQLGALEGRPLP